jgi:hypothetical protein
MTVPPQATGELAVEPTTPPQTPMTTSARLGGSSHLTFPVAPGTQVPMTVEGILGALRAAGTIWVLTPAGDPAATIELPWRLFFSPRPVGSSDVLVAAFAPVPLNGPAGATGIWRLRLQAASGLALLPLPPFDQDDSGFAPPLDAAARSQIGVYGTPPRQQPTAGSVELTALGGSLTAKGTWPDFAWEQRTVLGRDMSVHTVDQGVIYPLGHQAVLIKTTERDLVPPGAQSSDAILCTSLTLVVTERVMRPADHGPRAAREFPFDAVEILQRSFPLSSSDVLTTHEYVPKQLDALIASLTAATQAMDAQDEVVDQLRQAAVAMINQEFDDQTTQIDDELAPIAQQISDLEAAEQAWEDWVAAHPPQPPVVTPPVIVGPDGIGGNGTDGTGTGEGSGNGDGDPSPPQPDLSQLPALQAQASALTDQLLAIPAQRQQALDSIATVEGLAAQDGVYADAVAQASQLEADVAEITQHVDTVKAQQGRHPPVCERPAGPDGPLRVPVRCGDLIFSLPVLFVHDLSVPDSDDWPGFDALTDPDVRGALSTAWGSSGVVPLPGVGLDLVRSSPPNPLDVHEVHQLSVVAGPPAEPIRPGLDSLVIDLPAARTLLPGTSSEQAVSFTEDYLERGEVADVALRLTSPLRVDFTQAADRAGALIAPVFNADVLSRTQGLVTAATLPGAGTGPPSLGTVFRGATLLGIDLASVIDGLPAPLGIVPVLDGVRPVGARMAWDLNLTDHGPLRTKPDSTLTMSVERSPARTETTCRAVDFDFVLPPTGTELLRLHFTALEFTQTLGQPPHLGVTGLNVSLGGDLNLLKTLQDAVDLGGAAPAIRQTPAGVTASYALTVPEVAAGAFTLRNIAFSAGVDVPFDGRPVVASVSFASRDDPFNLSVLAFGGGGYLSFQIAQEGIRRLEASLDFGASVAISVGLASAEVHALGGIRFELQASGDVSATGFLRIGGSVDVLGLVSVSVELRVDLTYQEVRDPAGHVSGESLSGRATLVIEVDVTFWSGSIELDSGEYTFAGPDPGGGPPSVSTSGSPPTLPDWQDYRNAFAPEPT